MFDPNTWTHKSFRPFTAPGRVFPFDPRIKNHGLNGCHNKKSGSLLLVDLGTMSNHIISTGLSNVDHAPTGKMINLSGFLGHSL